MDRRNLVSLLGLAVMITGAFVWQAQDARPAHDTATTIATAGSQDQASQEVVSADWTTTELSSGKWIGMSQESLKNAAESYIELNKGHIQRVNFQNFRGNGAACSSSGCAGGGSCGGSCGGGCGSRLNEVTRSDSAFNVNNDCSKAANAWDSYCDPGLPGLPAPRSSCAGLTCLQCGTGGCGGGCGGGGFGLGTMPRGGMMAGMVANNIPSMPVLSSGCGGCGGGCAPATGCAGGCNVLAGFNSGAFGTDACGPNCGARRQITGVDSATCVKAGEPCWNMRGPIPWEMFAQGEYVGPHRLRHQDKYRLRVDDQIQLVYRVTRERMTQSYRMNVGDSIRLESAEESEVDRELVIQPDGMITARLLGQVLAAGRTADELRRDLEKRYEEFYNEPVITVTPVKVNTKLEDLRATVDSRAGNGGQTFSVVVSPDGTVQLSGLGSVPAHGMTLEELNMEVNARYAQLVPGIEVTAVLQQRAPRFIYVVGEVGLPGRVELLQPTTVTMAIAMAQGWNNGANLRNVVVFRRAEDWRLLATKVDIRGALYGTHPAPSDEIWLRDSDIVIVPKQPIKVLNDAIELIFTNGLYAAAPFFSDPIIFTDASTL